MCTQEFRKFSRLLLNIQIYIIQILNTFVSHKIHAIYRKFDEASMLIEQLLSMRIDVLIVKELLLYNLEKSLKCHNTWVHYSKLLQSTFHDMYCYTNYFIIYSREECQNTNVLAVVFKLISKVLPIVPQTSVIVNTE